MYTSEINRVDELCVKALIDKIGHKIKNITNFATEKSFSEYFESNIDFTQIFCSIELPGFKKERLRANVLPKEALDFEKLSKEINSELKIIQKEVASKHISSHELRTYFSFSSIGSDLGVCNLRLHNRNKLREEEDERLEYENHLKRMKEEDRYRKEYEWQNESYRPHGGAFNSIDDYYNFIR